MTITGKGAVLVAALALSACGDDKPKVVTATVRIYPAGPPAGACEPQPAPETTGINDWQTRATIYAASAAAALGQLRRCDQWIKGWRAEEAAGKAGAEGKR